MSLSTRRIFKPLSAIFNKAHVIPVLSITRIDDAVPLARALADGGLDAIEVALTTEHALSAIKKIRKTCPHITVGAATIIKVPELKEAISAGAQFGASPIYCEDLMRDAKKWRFPFMPSVGNTREINSAAKKGFLTQKFFPMDAMGDNENGEKFLRAVSTKAIFSKLGVTAYTSCLFTNRSDIKTYLKYDNVVAVASGWSAPEHLVKTRNWSAITALAKEDVTTAREVIAAKTLAIKK